MAKTITHSMDWLKTVAERHDEWVQMVHSFGEYESHEDIVQDAYIRLYKYSSKDKIIRNGKVIKPFMYITLRNTYRLHLNDKKKLRTISIDKTLEPEQNREGLEEKIATHKIDQKIDQIIKDWHWYDRKLFNIYRESGKSLRTIEQETNISLCSLFNTIKNCKKRIKEELGEDWQDYVNGDYDKL